MQGFRKFRILKNEKAKFAFKDLSGLQESFYLAKKMDLSLGGSEILQRTLQEK